MTKERQGKIKYMSVCLRAPPPGECTLNLLKDLMFGQLLLALRQFAGRRGLPTTIISDNAKTFKLSAKEVAKIICSSEVYETQQITEPLGSLSLRKPHGGVDHVLGKEVQDIKRSLRKTIGPANLSFDHEEIRVSLTPECIFLISNRTKSLFQGT